MSSLSTPYTYKSKVWHMDISPLQWRERILVLEGSIRGAVAAIIWWDCLSDRPWTQRAGELDDLIGRADSVTETELYAGLVAVGYPERHAARRITQGRFSPAATSVRTGARR